MKNKLVIFSIIFSFIIIIIIIIILGIILYNLKKDNNKNLNVTKDVFVNSNDF